MTELKMFLLVSSSSSCVGLEEGTSHIRIDPLNIDFCQIGAQTENLVCIALNTTVAGFGLPARGWEDLENAPNSGRLRSSPVDQNAVGRLGACGYDNRRVDGFASGVARKLEVVKAECFEKQ